MTVDELEKIYEGLGWVADQLATLPGPKAKRDAAHRQVILTHYMVAELALNLGKGMDLQKALKRMVTGWAPKVPPQ